MKSLRLATITLAVIAGSFVASTSRVAAQVVECKVPALLQKTDVWSQGATVQVNIDPAWVTTAERDALKAAFTNWNNAKTGSCPSITFATPTFDPTPIAGLTVPADPNVAKLQVYRRDPPEHPGDRGNTVGKDNGTYTLSAWININPAVTVPAALTQVLAHEIGHTMGLGECTNCGGKTSVMHAPAPSYNDTTGLPGPTTCDIAAGKQVMGCPYDGSIVNLQPLTIGAERWDFRFGYGVSLKQTEPGKVSVLVAWRQQGYAPATFQPPPSCDPSTSAISSQRAIVSFPRNGRVFDTANGTLTTTALQQYGHDYRGTYDGNLTDLGNTANVTINVSVTTGGRCASQTFALSPASVSLTLK